MNNQNKYLLTAKEASEFLGVTEGTLAVWRTNKRYKIPYVKIGGLIKYKLNDLMNWIESRTIGIKEAS